MEVIKIESNKIYSFEFPSDAKLGLINIKFKDKFFYGVIYVDPSGNIQHVFNSEPQAKPIETTFQEWREQGVTSQHIT